MSTTFDIHRDWTLCTSIVVYAASIEDMKQEEKGLAENQPLIFLLLPAFLRNLAAFLAPI